jgi:hypothetical protein
MWPLVSSGPVRPAQPKALNLTTSPGSPATAAPEVGSPLTCDAATRHVMKGRRDRGPSCSPRSGEARLDGKGSARPARPRLPRRPSAPARAGLPRRRGRGGYSVRSAWTCSAPCRIHDWLNIWTGAGDAQRVPPPCARLVGLLGRERAESRWNAEREECAQLPRVRASPAKGERRKRRLRRRCGPSGTSNAKSDRPRYIGVSMP